MAFNLLRSRRVRALSFTALGLTALGLTAPLAAADDDVAGTRSDKLLERRHTVAVTLDHGHATLVVRRTVHNGGARHDQATFWLATPESSVAVGLRTLGMAAGKPVWFTAELLEAEAAAARYHELTGIGGYSPKDPALLSWRHPGLLALQVFPVAPGTDKTVEYTLEMPTEYRGGKDHLVLPRLGTPGRAALATVETRDPRESLFAGERRLAPGAPLRLDTPDLDLAVSRAGARPLGGALAVVPFGPGRVLLRQRIDAAPRLGEVPAGARVVVLLDASRSQHEEDAAAEVAAARAYLAHFTGIGAEAEILTFDRRVTALHGGFVSIPKALATLDHLTLARRNGSRVDDALARAASLLDHLPAKLPRRVVVFTDALTRASLDAGALRTLAARTGALVHVGVVHGGEVELARDDDHPWATAVRPTGGLVWRAGGNGTADDADRMRAAYEELARPLRIDQLTVTIPGLDAGVFSYPERLAEGEGVADLRVVDRPIASLRVDGQIWAQPVSASLAPDADEARLAAALVFGSDDVRRSLTDPEMMTLAKLGHAVSPMTSLLAIEPGVRPSTEGLEEGEIGHGGGSGIGEAFGAGGGRFSGGGADLAAMLDRLIAPGWRACGGGAEKASLTVETTRAEVVDVSAVKVESGDASKAQCLAEVAWGLDLPLAFDGVRSRVFSVGM